MFEQIDKAIHTDLSFVYYLCIVHKIYSPQSVITVIFMIID